MRNDSRTPWYVTLVFLGLTHATPAEAAPPVPKPQAQSQAAARRFIAVLRPAVKDCPDRDDFTKSRMFAKSPVPGLKRYCVYTSALVAKAPGRGTEFLRVDPDHDILVPQGDSNVKDVLTDAYLQSVGPFGSIGTQTIYTSTTNLPHIAIVDTAPGRIPYDSADTAKHGLAMAAIAEAVRCPTAHALGKPCRALTSFHNAFPSAHGATGLRAPALDVDNRGLGSLMTLAEAIVQAASTGKASRLVINLSLGWDPAFALSGGNSLYDAGDFYKKGTSSDPLAVTTIPVPVQAVHAALVYASCHGALTIAAAGNNIAGACEQTGPLEPAAWESLRAPTPGECAAFFDEPLEAFLHLRPGSGSPIPLIYAAGGITPSEQPLPISRFGGTPRRVLPAFMAIGGDDAWSGTSIAAAALSGIAAAVWTYRPTWSAHQVMAWLDETGKKTALPVELAQTTPEQKAVRISGTRAYYKMCGVIPGCRFDKLPTTNTDELVQAELVEEALQTPDATGKTAQATLPRRRLSTCGATASAVAYNGTISAGAPVPIKAPFVPTPLLPPPAQPWARPQPEIPICSTCPIKGGKLLVSLNQAYKPNLLNLEGGRVKLIQPTLEFFTEATGYVSTTLPDVVVGDDGLEIDLALYSAPVGKAMVNLATFLSDPAIEAGTLSVVVEDALGRNVRVVSVIPVYP